MAINLKTLQHRVNGTALLAIAPGLGVAFLFAPAWLASTALGLALLAFLSLHFWLRPAREAASLLRASAAGTPAEGQSDSKLLGDETRRLLERLETLEHRWVRRHAITGLPIRESLLERIDAHILGPSGPVLVGAFRLADYKRLAAFDPDAAEAALKVFAERLAQSLGKDRMIAHVDRDCFAVLFEHREPQAARREMSALCYAMSGQIEVDGLALIPEVESGAAIYPEDGQNGAALLNQALVRLSRTTEAGTARGPAANASEVARERFVIEQGLRLAIERHELALNFQPVVDLSSGLLVGAEALLRWHHPQIGLISPSRFIPILEDSDLTSEIGLWTLNAACEAARSWHQLGLDQLRVAVNLSGRQLGNLDLKEAIERTLKRHTLSPGCLEIELTETAAAQDAERTRHLFRQLRSIGVTIAIDDFGSGYSSLSYLKNLPFDKLKIDREFVEQVHLRRDSRAICRSLVELSRGLGISVLAEGVETVEEVETLSELGCTLFQGFYFSKPLSGADFIHFALHPGGRSQRPGARDQQPLRRQGLNR